VQPQHSGGDGPHKAQGAERAACEREGSEVVQAFSTVYYRTRDLFFKPRLP